MKRKVVKTLLSVSVAASMALSAPAAAWASEETAQTESTEAGAETESEADAAAEEEPEDIQIVLADGDLTIKNQTTRTFTEAELQERNAADTAEETLENDGETVQENASAEETDTAQETEADSEEAADTSETDTDEDLSTSLVLTEENGEVHIFGQADVKTWTNPVIFDEYGFLYIKYEDADGSTKEVAETAQEKEFEGAVTMYASSNVHIREKADQESESLTVLQLGDEVTGIGAVPGWIKVKSGDITGYVYHSYVTENKASVDALVQAKKEAEEAAAAQAAAQAAADAAAAQAAADAAAAQAAADAAAQQQQQQEVYEVSRQKFDDCDGSGHGYYEITYSDGSVAYEEY